VNPEHKGLFDITNLGRIGYKISAPQSDMTFINCQTLLKKMDKHQEKNTWCNLFMQNSPSFVVNAKFFLPMGYPDKQYQKHKKENADKFRPVFDFKWE
jgi:hypothetical protein